MTPTVRMCLTTTFCVLLATGVWAEDSTPPPGEQQVQPTPRESRGRLRPGRPAPPSSERPPEPPPPPATGGYRGRQLELPSGPAQPTHLELTILQLVCPTGILPGIEINRFAAGNATPSVILERLQQYGDASVGFRVDNLINLPAGADITQGARVPTVQDVVVSGNGVVTPSVTYEKVGAIVKIRGLWREDDPQLADVAAKIEVAAITQTPVRIHSGISLPAFGQLSLEQTLQVRNGVPCCSLINGNPVKSDTESVSTVHFLYLRLTRVGEPASAPPAAAASPPSPQTMIQASVFEVAGEKEKLAQIDLGKEPPTDPKKLEETIGWFGKMNEVSRPSLLAIWPSKSTLTMSMTMPVAAPASERQTGDQTNRDRRRATIGTQRVEVTLGIDGHWSDGDPKQGKIEVVLSQKVRARSGPNAQTQPAETKLLAAETSIRDGVPCCLLGEILPGTGQEDQARRYVMLLTARRIAEMPAKPNQPK